MDFVAVTEMVGVPRDRVSLLVSDLVEVAECVPVEDSVPLMDCVSESERVALGSSDFDIVAVREIRDGVAVLETVVLEVTREEPDNVPDGVAEKLKLLDLVRETLLSPVSLSDTEAVAETVPWVRDPLPVPVALRVMLALDRERVDVGCTVGLAVAVLE